MTLKAYRYRLYPNAVEQNKLAQHFGCTRLVFNLYLEANQKAYCNGYLKSGPPGII